jgi:hypothetical protein
MTLFEMSNTARQLYELLESGEIDEQTVLDTMESIGASEKLESYVFIQKQLEAEIAAFKAEIERMTERKRSLEANVERMKRAQIDYMKATGQRKATAGTFTLSLRESKSVKVLDEAAIPETYWKPQPAKLDKAGIKDALKAGESVPGCEIETSFSVIAR